MFYFRRLRLTGRPPYLSTAHVSRSETSLPTPHLCAVLARVLGLHPLFPPALRQSSQVPPATGGPPGSPRRSHASSFSFCCSTWRVAVGRLFPRGHAGARLHFVLVEEPLRFDCCSVFGVSPTRCVDLSPAAIFSSQFVPVTAQRRACMGSRGRSGLAYSSHH